MTIHKMVIKRVAPDYYTFTDYELIETRKGAKWESGRSWAEPRAIDLPPECFSHNNKPFTSISKDGESRVIYFITCEFPNPAFIGRGWINPQGDEIPDRPSKNNNLCYVGCESATGRAY